VACNAFQGGRRGSHTTNELCCNDTSDVQQAILSYAFANQRPIFHAPLLESFNSPLSFIDRGGVTYTIDTLRDLKEKRPDAELFFITGADAVAQILSWRDHDELWELAHFVAVSRPGHVLSTDGLPSDNVSQLEVPALSISSTACRARVRDDEPVWYLVPDGVVQYIAKHHLYRSKA
jgi:nicotinic acid mononucleotide adenylyltransferase